MVFDAKRRECRLVICQWIRIRRCFWLSAFLTRFLFFSNSLSVCLSVFLLVTLLSLHFPSDCEWVFPFFFSFLFFLPFLFSSLSFLSCFLSFLFLFHPFSLFLSFFFLDALSHLYKRVWCPSIRLSVRRSNGPSVGWEFAVWPSRDDMALVM